MVYAAIQQYVISERNSVSAVIQFWTD